MLLLLVLLLLKGSMQHAAVWNMGILCACGLLPAYSQTVLCHCRWQCELMMAAHCSLSGPLNSLHASTHLSRLSMGDNQFTGGCYLHIRLHCIAGQL